MQRSREYGTLVDVFGPWILDLVSQVCVSRVDVISNEDLEAMGRDPLEADRIERIRARIASGRDWCARIRSANAQHSIGQMRHSFPSPCRKELEIK